MTTIAGWVPWLAGTLDPCDGQEAFDTYVRQDSVLLAPGEAGRSTVPHWLPWMPVRDQRWRTGLRACPACAASPDRGTSLLAALPIMTSCAEHACRLEPEMTVRLAALDRDPVPSPPVREPVAAMDRFTHEGLTTGMVTLPRRAVHVGVWLRLLRTLLDEVSMAASRVSPRSAATLAAVWDATGRQARAGLKVWRPYERLDSQHQQAMLEAAATALTLAEVGEVTARGTLGPLLTREPHHDVHEGDRRAWEHKQARAEFDAMIARARADPDTASRLLAMLTADSRTTASFYRQRQYLTGLGIPEGLLPDHRALGRADLRPEPQVFQDNLRYRATTPTMVRCHLREHRNAGAVQFPVIRQLRARGRNRRLATSCGGIRSPAASTTSSPTWRTRTGRAIRSALTTAT
jgi:hypothetical protein